MNIYVSFREQKTAIKRLLIPILIL